MKRIVYWPLLPTLAVGLLFSQNPMPRPVLGGVLPGATAAERTLFEQGKDDFNEVEKAEDGLGPAFNGDSCAQCHASPAIGGVANTAVIRAGQTTPDGRFVALHGDTLFSQFSTGDRACQVNLPAEANTVVRRIPTPLFGAGLIEAIPDEAIIAREDPDDRNHDGIRGRAHRVVDVASRLPRVGRFGWKAQVATLLTFAGDAYRNEMGITNDLFKDEYALGFTPAQIAACGGSSTIEDKRSLENGLRGIDNFENFMRLLAPLPPGRPTEETDRGRDLFAAVGCAKCHTPQMFTEESTNLVFNRKPVPLFSDLLLHDVGTGDGIPQGKARGSEMRTAPLWGLSYRRMLLHDGSATSPDGAIRRHGREADGVRRNYDRLSPEERRALVAFLNTI